MKILVTGSKGFVGRNLVNQLQNIKDGKCKRYPELIKESAGELIIYEHDRLTSDEQLEAYCKDCDFVFNLVAAHKPKKESDYVESNVNFLSKLLNYLKIHDNKAPIVLTSSIHDNIQSDYGITKMKGRKILDNYSKKLGVKTYIFRLSHVFGKWTRPNYNSVIATFCYNVSRNIPIVVHDRDLELTLLYIDDVVRVLINCITGNVVKEDGICEIQPSYKIKLGRIADLIYEFKYCRDNITIPNLADSLINNLYSTYLSFIPTDDFSRELKMNVDCRGSFTEFMKTKNCGQFSINISKPKITRGDHWHHTKNEKFLVVSGIGVIRFRKIDTDEVIEYFVSDEKFEIVDIPTGYTHNIENLGDRDMVTVMWSNEIFDINKPDTYAVKV